MTDHIDDALEEAVRAQREAEALVAASKLALRTSQDSLRRARPKVAAAVVAAARKGRSVAYIRRITGHSRQRIYQILDEADVTPVEDE